jgi:hypothetical protein
MLSFLGWHVQRTPSIRLRTTRQACRVGADGSQSRPGMPGTAFKQGTFMHIVDGALSTPALNRVKPELFSLLTAPAGRVALR